MFFFQKFGINFFFRIGNFFEKMRKLEEIQSDICCQFGVLSVFVRRALGVAQCYLTPHQAASKQKSDKTTETQTKTH